MKSAFLLAGLIAVLLVAGCTGQGGVANKTTGEENATSKLAEEKVVATAIAQYTLTQDELAAASLSSPNAWTISEPLQRTDGQDEVEERLSYGISGTRAGDQFGVTLHIYPSSTAASEASAGICTEDVKKTLALGEKSCITELIIAPVPESNFPGRHMMYADYVYKSAVVKIEYNPAVADDFALDSATISKYFEDYLNLQDKKLTYVLKDVPSAEKPTAPSALNPSTGIASFSTENLPALNAKWSTGSFDDPVTYKSVSLSNNGRYAVGVGGDVRLFDSGNLLWSYSTWNDTRSAAVSDNGEYVVVAAPEWIFIFEKTGNLLKTVYKKDLCTGNNPECYIGKPFDVVGITPDGLSVIKVGSDLYVFDRDGNEVWRKEALYAELAEDNKRVFTNIEIHDVETGSLLDQSSFGVFDNDYTSVSKDVTSMITPCRYDFPDVLCMFDLTSPMTDPLRMLWSMNYTLIKPFHAKPLISPNGKYAGLGPSVMFTSDATSKDSSSFTGHAVFKDSKKVWHTELSDMDGGVVGVNLIEDKLTNCGSILAMYENKMTTETELVFFDSGGAPRWKVVDETTGTRFAASDDGKIIYVYGGGGYADHPSMLNYYENSQYACS
jgi:hypothetical protein